MADDDTVFDGSTNSTSGNAEKGRKPILGNSNDAVAAWLNRGEDSGNAYLSISLPLGLGNVSIFPENDTVQNAFNQLADHLEAELDDH